ncbi:MAG: CIA30 family protein [bacterium]
MIRKLSLAVMAVLLLAGVTILAQTDSTEPAKVVPAPIPTIVPEGVLYDFEGDTIVLRHGWIGVTDTLIGGRSTSVLSIVADGANGSKQALQMTGTVISDNPYVMFGGGSSRFGHDSLIAFDVSGLTGVRFWAKGDGNTYRIDLPTAGITDYMFYSFAFTPPADEWREYKIPFKGFKQQPYGAKVPWTGTDVIGVHFFTVGGPLEKFKLLVDQIEFYK